MKRTKVESGLERQFLTAMVVNKAFLGSVVPLLVEDHIRLFTVRYVEQIIRWCIHHYQKYEDAPGQSIEAVYHAWVANEKPKDDEAETVGAFLASLSEAHEAAPIVNVPHLLEEFANHLNLKKVLALAENLMGCNEYGRTAEALAAVQSFRTVEAGGSVGYRLKGKDAIKRAFADAMDPVIVFPGDAGHFLNDALTRDTLIGIQAAEKKGKTWWLIEFATRALRNRKKVAVFQCGDLSESQFTKRMAMRMAAVPLWAKQCSGVNFPQSINILKGPDGFVPEVIHTSMTFAAPLDEHIAYKAQKRFWRRYKMSGDELRISVHANSSISVAGIQAILERWKQEDGFVPDAIIVDYADILAPEDPRKEPRHQVNETWKALRRLSQVWHACVIAPTQANAAAYGAKTQGMHNVSEDKRKFAHVTGMLGLNQTPTEKAMGVMRLNWIALRESEYSVSRPLWVAQCLPLGLALVKSKL